MSNSNDWQQAVKLFLPILEAFLQKTLPNEGPKFTLKKINDDDIDKFMPSLPASSSIIHFSEQLFSADLLLGFDNSWSGLYQHLNQVFHPATDHKSPLLALSKEMTACLTDVLSEIGVETKVSDGETLTKKKAANTFFQDDCLVAFLQAEPKSDEESLGLWVVLTPPDPEKVANLETYEGDENLFASKQSVEIVKNQITRHLRNLINRLKDDDSMNGQHVEFEDFGSSSSSVNTSEVRNIDLLKNVEMHVSVEIGRRKMTLGKILQLAKGSVIELEKMAGEPVEILVNGHTIAQGDVVVIDEHFGVRISSLLVSQERIKTLQ